MLSLLKHFVVGERGESVAWIVVVIIGVIIAVAAFLKFKNSPGALGKGIEQAGSNAARGLQGVRIQ
jgi:hypothetical protein